MCPFAIVYAGCLDEESQISSQSACASTPIPQGITLYAAALLAAVDAGSYHNQ